MARIRGVPEDEESLELRVVKRFARRKVGAVPEPVGVMGHQPWMLRAAGAFELALERSRSVEPRLKELAQIKAAMLVGCPF